MATDKWETLFTRAWRHGTEAAHHGEIEEARFWFGRARIAAHLARRPLVGAFPPI